MLICPLDQPIVAILTLTVIEYKKICCAGRQHGGRRHGEGFVAGAGQAPRIAEYRNQSPWPIIAATPADGDH